jgi:hypothetical protein
MVRASYSTRTLGLLKIASNCLRPLGLHSTRHSDPGYQCTLRIQLINTAAGQSCVMFLEETTCEHVRDGMDPGFVSLLLSCLVVVPQPCKNPFACSLPSKMHQFQRPFCTVLL